MFLAPAKAHRGRWRRFGAHGGRSVKCVVTVATAALIASSVSGCVPVIGALTLNDLMTGTSLFTTALTGKSLTDYALGAVTGEDCSVMGAVLEKDRHICEVNGSKATQSDFKGLIAMGESSKAQPQPTPQPQPAADMKVAADPGTIPVRGDVPLGAITAHVPVRELPAALTTASADAQPGTGP